MRGCAASCWESRRPWRWPGWPRRIVQPSEAVTLKRNRVALSLNNGGDTIELLAPDGRVVQTFAYNAVKVDEVVLVP